MQRFVAKIGSMGERNIIDIQTKHKHQKKNYNIVLDLREKHTQSQYNNIKWNQFNMKIMQKVLCYLFEK